MIESASALGRRPSAAGIPDLTPSPSAQDLAALGPATAVAPSLAFHVPQANSSWAVDLYDWVAKTAATYCRAVPPPRPGVSPDIATRRDVDQVDKAMEAWMDQHGEMLSLSSVITGNPEPGILRIASKSISSQQSGVKLGMLIRDVDTKIKSSPVPPTKALRTERRGFALQL
jgi:hypothetical protein